VTVFLVRTVRLCVPGKGGEGGVVAVGVLRVELFHLCWVEVGNRRWGVLSFWG